MGLGMDSQVKQRAEGSLWGLDKGRGCGFKLRVGDSEQGEGKVRETERLAWRASCRQFNLHTVTLAPISAFAQSSGQSQSILSSTF